MQRHILYFDCTLGQVRSDNPINRTSPEGYENITLIKIKHHNQAIYLAVEAGTEQ